MDFSQRLQALIDKEKIFQKDLAKALNIGDSRVTDWISGKVKTPRRNTCVKIAEFFGCNVDWLQKGEGEPFPNNCSSTSIKASGDVIGAGNIGNTRMGSVSKQTGQKPEEWPSDFHKMAADLLRNVDKKTALEVVNLLSQKIADQDN